MPLAGVLDLNQTVSDSDRCIAARRIGCRKAYSRRKEEAAVKSLSVIVRFVTHFHLNRKQGYPYLYGQWEELLVLSFRLMFYY